MTRAEWAMTAGLGTLVAAALGSVISADLAARRHPPRTALAVNPTAAPVALNVGDVVTVNGQQMRVSYSLVPDTSAPPPPPPPAPGWVDGWRNSRRDWTLSAQEGDLVFLVGGGFGAVQGQVLLDTTIKAPVVAWSNTEIAVTLPHVAAAPHVPRVDVLSPAGALLASQSAGAVTIIPKPAVPQGVKKR